MKNVIFKASPGVIYILDDSDKINDCILKIKKAPTVLVRAKLVTLLDNPA